MPIHGRFAPQRALQRAALAGCLSLGSAACSSEADGPSDMDGAAGSSVVPPSGNGMTAGSSGSTAGTAGSTPGGDMAGSSGTTASSGAGTGDNAGAAGAMPAAGSGTAGVGTAGAGPDLSGLEPFSFFVTSYAAMQRLSGTPDGFGGDLRYGEADGLSGADKICTEIAETSMPGSGAKVWRAFLSVTKGPDGKPLGAIDRIGEGPWYDRVGRLFAMNKAALMDTRPMGADPAIIDDFPNEDGVPNHDPDGTGEVDNHDTLTGSNAMGQPYCTDGGCTCADWTSAEGATGTPRVGHSWPRNGGPGGGMLPGGFGGGGESDPAHWISSLDEAGCAPGASLIELGPPNPAIPTVGSGGGYGGIYCFALNP